VILLAAGSTSHHILHCAISHFDSLPIFIESCCVAHTAQGVGASVQHQPPKASGQYTLQSTIPPIHQFDTGMKFA
jgi:hypothetical protein